MIMVSRILIVCLGNICRSPAASAFFEAVIENHELPCLVESAGIQALDNAQADPIVCGILKKKYNIDLSFHRSRQLQDSMMIENDLILVMTHEQQYYLETHYSYAVGKIYTLGKWRKAAILDPYGQSKKTFDENIVLIKECVSDWTEKLWHVTGCD